MKNILIFLFFILNSGCSISADDIKRAEKQCEPFGGLSSYQTVPFTLFCKDGTSIIKMSDDNI